MQQVHNLYRVAGSSQRLMQGLVLVGEVKWGAVDNPARLLAELADKATRLPFVRDRDVVTALWTRAPSGAGTISPREVLDVLR